MKYTVIILLILFNFAFSFANNIATSNVTRASQNTTSMYSDIKFDISWENSWRTSTNEKNFDGAWIFAKFRKANTSLWQHCSLNYVAPGDAASCGNAQAAGSLLKTSADGKGVWMYRAVDGIGNVSWANNSIRWNYGTDGVLNTDSVEIRLYAVELVLIPEGAYYLGSGSTTENYRFRDGANDTYLNITSEDALTVGTSAGNIFGYAAANAMASGSIPAAFPKGFKAFWIMKHELSQQCYADFLNTLDAAGATARNMGMTGTHPNLIAPIPERALESMSMVDLLAWTDWAAMRPFTEMEYEKACRGSNILPIPNEYPWGNTTLVQISGTTNVNTVSEAFNLGNCNYYFGSSVARPVRVGSIADATSDRINAGATYYGVMEMAGNTWERTVSAGYAQGRAFTGLHGDGKLTTTWTHNVTNWPLNTGEGFGFRGGAYNMQAVAFNIQTSDRLSTPTIDATRVAAYGGRAARTVE